MVHEMTNQRDRCVVHAAAAFLPPSFVCHRSDPSVTSADSGSGSGTYLSASAS